MSTALVCSGIVVVLAAALRSTWSPCGWSMLSTITPLSERGRGHRFAMTAAWFVGGAVVGGALLGGLGAAAAALVAALGLPVTTRLAVAGVAALLAAALDARVVGPPLPHHRRQVNEAWLDEFRPWVYASGFGLQIGAGLATYIMTAGVYLVILVGALTAAPAAAWGLGIMFGFARGLAVLAGWRNTDPSSLAAFHRRFAALDEPIRIVVGVVLAGVGIGTLAVAAGAPTWCAVVVPLATATAAVLRSAAPRSAAPRIAGQDAGSTVIPASASLTTPTSDDRRADEPTTA